MYISLLFIGRTVFIIMLISHINTAITKDNDKIDNTTTSDQDVINIYDDYFSDNRTPNKGLLNLIKEEALHSTTDRQRNQDIESEYDTTEGTSSTFEEKSTTSESYDATSPIVSESVQNLSTSKISLSHKTDLNTLALSKFNPVFDDEKSNLVINYSTNTPEYIENENISINLDYEVTTRAKVTEDNYDLTTGIRLAIKNDSNLSEIYRKQLDKINKFKEIKNQTTGTTKHMDLNFHETSTQLNVKIAASDGMVFDEINDSLTSSLTSKLYTPKVIMPIKDINDKDVNKKHGQNKKEISFENVTVFNAPTLRPMVSDRLDSISRDTTLTTEIISYFKRPLIYVANQTTNSRGEGLTTNRLKNSAATMSMPNNYKNTTFDFSNVSTVSIFLKDNMPSTIRTSLNSSNTLVIGTKPSIKYPLKNKTTKYNDNKISNKYPQTKYNNFVQGNYSSTKKLKLLRNNHSTRAAVLDHGPQDMLSASSQIQNDNASITLNNNTAAITTLQPSLSVNKLSNSRPKTSVVENRNLRDDSSNLVFKTELPTVKTETVNINKSIFNNFSNNISGEKIFEKGKTGTTHNFTLNSNTSENADESTSYVFGSKIKDSIWCLSYFAIIGYLISTNVI